MPKILLIIMATIPGLLLLLVVASFGEVLWKLESGDFPWYRFAVEEIEYNKPVAY
ncbi:hypothetical protein [Desulfurispora thermophila]|uniref:hypothetical protein n=1 Tax=Desulfurispora thermophila TaxID=265470 RepID=UPI00037DAB4A|nr:hypothetical protein [Desulfurispora thermophila]